MTKRGLATLMLMAALSGCAGRMARPVAVVGASSAVARAEASAAASPASPESRLALARAYLAAGRFASAAAAFRDTLALAPGDRRATVGLALMAIAGGRADEVLPLLDRLPADDIDAALARALAGDAAGAVARLDRAARGPAADGRTRQNLALALAIAGRWVDARAVAAEDLAPEAVDRRLGEWAMMAGAGNAASRVATLLGVRIAADPGQPAMLALGQQAPARVLMATPTAIVPPPPVPFPPPAVEAAAAPPPPLRPVGRYVVQLGAFADSAAARDAWRGWARAMPGRMALAGLGPRAGATLVRLSVGGLAGLAEARALCRTITDGGGSCFVRPRGDDRPARWLSA